MFACLQDAHSRSDRRDLEAATYAKVAWRLIPLLFTCYVVAYIDRVNVGFARLQMSRDLGFSETAYGTAAGIFFIGYLLFEVPSNIALSRVGARLWIGRIMVTWGVVASLQMFVCDETTFCMARFFLGVAEAGFFPGVILYLTNWFPPEYRARMVSWLMLAVALSGVVGGPVSGMIMQLFDGLASFRGWQWLFLLQGIPASLMGVVVMALLPDSPESCSWLREEERALLIRNRDASVPADAGRVGGMFGAFRSGRVWVLAALYFFMGLNLYGISFWMPQIIHESITRNPVAIGWISALPWLSAALFTVLVGRHSDRTGERRWHVAAPILFAAAAFALCATPAGRGWSGIFALVVAASGILSASTCFWAIPPMVLGSGAAAAGIALINSVGNAAGYVSPGVVGVIRDGFGRQMSPVFLLFSGSLLIAAFLAVSFRYER